MFKLLLLLINLWIWSVLGLPSDPRFSGQIPIPEHCGHDVNFCHTYCLSIDPGTVSARCAQDLISCICVNGHGQSIGVRFVQDREPLSLEERTMSTSTSTTSVPEPAQPPLQFDYAPSSPVPTLLECDGLHDSDSICHDFCTLEISAYRGVCDLSDKTCRCEGVDPAIVQPAPIPAMFIPRYPPSTTTTTLPPHMTHSHLQPVVMQNSFWTPVATNQEHQMNNGDTMQQNQNFQQLQPLAQPPMQQQMIPDYIYSQWYPLQFHYNQQMQPLQTSDQSQQYFRLQPTFETYQQPMFQTYHFSGDQIPEEQMTMATPVPQVVQPMSEAPTTDMMTEFITSTPFPQPTVLSEVPSSPEIDGNHKEENNPSRKKRSASTGFHWHDLFGARINEDVVRLTLTSPEILRKAPVIDIPANLNEDDEGLKIEMINHPFLAY